ncbi:DAK2 domain-containing protein [Azospirillum sp. YIM B02556]|uniref:DAK2 domain-containing protein n=1 Tax=Azospirillum endophyticum TaxID=2800326 RepID=A0ABS1F4T1_9PROT|nr:DAK2 domain-containing protein [Azospirillum endophyticum]MBK1838420.1 DAK2 domain-containing protein [Azospirillum endophyticum]
MDATDNGLTVAVLAAALDRWADRMDTAADELNALDARLGDGDLGATLGKCAQNIRAIRPGLDATSDGDLGQAFKTCAMACSKASGSSFGTLLAVAFLTAAKATAGRSALPCSELPQLLGDILGALSARGGAALGDKTVLDPLDAVRAALASLAAAERDDPATRHAAAVRATERTIEVFRDKPNRIGRARMFAERSVGLDDPGMIAFRHMVESLKPA